MESLAIDSTSDLFLGYSSSSKVYDFLNERFPDKIYGVALLLDQGEDTETFEIIGQAGQGILYQPPERGQNEENKFKSVSAAALGIDNLAWVRLTKNSSSPNNLKWYPEDLEQKANVSYSEEILKRYKNNIAILSLPFGIPDKEGANGNKKSACLLVTANQVIFSNQQLEGEILDSEFYQHFKNDFDLIQRYLELVFSPGPKNENKDDQPKYWNRLPLPAYSEYSSRSELCPIKYDGENDAEDPFVAVAYADLRNCTQLTKTASKLVRKILLGITDKPLISPGYFEAASKLAHCFRGEIDKFMGDGIMALFSENEKTQLKLNPGEFTKLLAKKGQKTLFDEHTEKSYFKDATIYTPENLNDKWLNILKGRGTAKQINWVENLLKELNKLEKMIDCAKRATRWSIMLNKFFLELPNHIDLSEKDKQDLKSLKIGIGINIGQANLGIFGSRWQSQYTALGTIINYGKKIEGHASKKNCSCSKNTTSQSNDDLIQLKCENFPILIGLCIPDKLEFIFDDYLDEKFVVKTFTENLGTRFEFSKDLKNKMCILNDENFQIWENLFDRYWDFNLEEKQIFLDTENNNLANALGINFTSRQDS